MKNRLCLTFMGIIFLAGYTGRDASVTASVTDPLTVDIPKLPRVLVVGDSISINYHKAAKAALKGTADYYRIEGNGGPSDRGVSDMELWLGDYTKKGLQWDVIQFNHGLHDLKQPYDKAGDTWGDHQVSIEDYKKNLEKEIHIMKKTGAKLIWCSTTPVPNSNLGKYARRKGESEVFNKAAMEVISKYPEIQVNDLHKFISESKVFDDWRKGTDVHFWSKDLQALVGKAVADAITKALTVTSTACLREDFLTWKFGMFIHFNMATFNEREWASGYEDPATFAPEKKLDCNQWADVAIAAGMKYAVLTVKHTGGWCLWDSKHTNHDITAFKNYKNGRGDIVRQFVDACRKRGIKVGMYYCFPGNFSRGKLPEGAEDLHGLPPEAKGDYTGFIKKQLTELLTGYGPIDLLWADQYSNKYTRDDWHQIKQHVKSLQPNCIVIANNSLNLRDTDIHSYEYPWLKNSRPARALPPEGNEHPAEVCDKIGPGWFWNSRENNASIKSAEEVVDMLELCNSRRANYLLNVVPDKSGLIPAYSLERLRQIGKLLAAKKAGRATEYHVSTAGLDGNPGTRSKPFKTISAAAAIAQPGDTITVHGGVYREQINPPRGGTSDDKRIIYQAAPGEKVVVKGSEVVKGWEKVQDNVWKVTLGNSFFGDFNPYSDVIGGEWYRTPKGGFDHHTGAVYLNGNWLDEAKDIENVLVPVGVRPLWKAQVDKKNTTIWAQFKDIDPNKEMVEINVRQSIFYPDKPGLNFITVRGFTMRHAAAPWSGAMSEQIGLIGTHWSKGWVIENNVISHSMNTGITLGRYDLGKYGIALPAVSAPGFVKSCELALEHGWSKDKIGSHIVRKNHISHCEKNGIHGSLGGIFSTIEGNTICDIAQRGWIGGPDVAGLKLLASNDVIISGNHIYRCAAVGGAWLDWMAQGTRMTGNLLHDNTRDLFMEVDHGPFLIDNNIFLSKRGIADWSQGAAYSHNLIAGSVSWRTEKRKTPYFKPHSIKDMKLSNIQHKDLRFYNNMFAGSGGLSAFGEKAVNTQAAGNVYLADAKPSAHDNDALVVADFKPGLKLQEKPDGWWLEMAVDPAWTTKQKRDVVTTELLGKAKIPDALFEQPGGTSYKLDTDYFGKKRNTVNPAPGPFKLTSEKLISIKVWPGNNQTDISIGN